MIRALAIAAALAFTASSALAAGGAPYTMDAKGKCHDSAGKFAKAAMCAAPAAASNKCRDVKTKKFAKCGAPGTEPVPAKK